MNHSEILNDVCIYYGIDKPSSYASAQTDSDFDKIFLAIEDAEGEIFLERSFKFREREGTFSTIAGKRNYTNSYGLIRTDGLYMPDIQFNPLPYYSNTDLEDFITDTSQGKPEKWTIRNYEILFYPIPDSVYTVTIQYDTQYYAINSTGYPIGTPKLYMNTSTDKPNYPDNWHKLVVFKALMNLLDSDQDTGKYMKFEKKYKDMLKQMAKESIGSKEAGTRFIIGREKPSRLTSAIEAVYRSGLRG